MPRSKQTRLSVAVVEIATLGEVHEPRQHLFGEAQRVQPADLGGARLRLRKTALLDAPEFELMILELCDMAGHILQKDHHVGDPNDVHNGETTLAWHFTTDQGNFLMVEYDEAYLISPETKEIIAAVEFEEADVGLAGA